MRDRTYTGGTCSPTKPSQDIQQEKDDTQEATKPKQPECSALGNGQTACKKPNGDYCATASTGKSFCWQPTETGKKIDGNDAQVKSKQGEPVTPPNVKIDDKDWQRKEGHQATACINNTCVNYNVTNYQTVPAGSAKNSTGDNKADGSGNTSGNGAPDKDNGEKGDDDDGDSASDSGNCEVAPACTGNTLKCLHLRYTWKIECNSRSGEISNGDGCGTNDLPICAGSSCKAEAYSQLLQQWKQRCSMQAMGEGMAARAAAIGGSNGDDAGVVDGIWGGEDGGSGLTLRRDLISVSAGGSLLPTGISIEGQAWEVPQGFYDAIAAIRMVIIAMCTVIAMFVVGRSI
ncbi:A coat protein [Stenotrophomonas sp.]|uniref:A coat protein n=1 Tax=Stenotrophomonas sp. TaxID=69392 RepID=UPI0028A07BA1|nr:A coat protein [Stenotrophomonas sp.]